jgi:DNA invertase Pin-like site-specific DNA recombinase
VMRAALYARVSTCDQSGAAQLARLREWASREGNEVAIERVDIATGRHVQRPGFAEIMAEARGHHVHVVAVCKVDRWARSVLHLATSVRELHDLGVEFVAVDQGLRISRHRGDPTSALILNVLASVGEWESSIISERTRESLAHLKASGRRLGRPPKKPAQRMEGAPTATRIMTNPADPQMVAAGIETRATPPTPRRMAPRPAMNNASKGDAW